ncbi:MAG TPA: GNAT family N-acetyltransferase [Longimicrobiales bacterium]
MPEPLRTERLHLRPWSEADASLLLPLLEANAAHLNGWIPRHVAEPAPLPELRARLAGFADDFAAARSWRFAIFSLDQETLFGEVDLFFRSEHGRVPLASADRVEIGYWLRSDVTGRGYATEASRAMVALAFGLPGMKHVEIRCDARNQASAAVPKRLGFHLAHPGAIDGAGDKASSSDMIWILELPTMAADMT